MSSKSQKPQSMRQKDLGEDAPNMQKYSGKSNAQEVEKMKNEMEKNKTSFSGSSQQVSIPSISSISDKAGSESATESAGAEGGAVGGSNGGVSQAASTPPSGNGGAGNPDAVTATVGDKKVDPASATAPNASTQAQGPASNIPSASGPGVSQSPSGPSSSADGISAADVNFGQDIVNGTSQTPTPSTPNSGSEVDTPSTTTPTPSTPSYDDNRAPSVRSMWMQNNRVRWDDIVDIDINGSDPNWDPLSWKLEWSGTNGFSHEEEIGFPDADKPTINNWIQTALPLAGSGLKKGDQLTCKATVFDPSGLSDSDTIVIEIRNAPPEIKSITPDKNEYLMTDVATVEIVAEDLDMDDIYWTYNWAGTDVQGSGEHGPGEVLTIEVDLNEARVLPGGELRGFVEVDDRDGGTDSENFALPVVDIENQVDEIGAVEVWFTSGNGVDTNIEVNDPPEIEMLGLQNSSVIPGGRTTVTGQAWDPEGMDLTWSWSWTGRGVNRTGSSNGDNISLPNMETAGNAVPGEDVYTFTATVNDGFLDSKEESIQLRVDELPPVIESLNMPSRVVRGRGFTLSGDGHDPMGHDDLLDWTILPSSPITGGTRNIQDEEQFSISLGTESANKSGPVRVILTNEAGLTDEKSLGITTYDPIVFDLNRDGKVDVVGGDIVSKEISMPAGEWEINTDKQGSDATRYVLNDVNLNSGAHVADKATTTEVHSTKRWKLGVEQMSDGENWTPIDITNDPTLRLDEGATNGSGVSTIEAGGARLKATRISDKGYADDGLGVNSVAGDMMLFDIDPTKWSWSDGSPDLRPGTGNNDVVPRHPGGHVEYDTGEKENIPKSGVWSEDISKGSSARIYNSAGEWVAEWVGGEEPMYYWGTREDRERTQWLSGNGDGMLVWDRNNDGIISDATELMSEFDAEGNVAFADGWEKLSHYFDSNQDGIVKGSELEGLQLWVDNGDAQTQAGELMELEDYGIFSIEIPQNGSWVSSAQSLGINSTVQLGFMAVLTRSPTNSEFSHHVANMGTGQSLKDFVAELLALDEFQSEVAERGIDAVIFDMIKNLLHKIPNTEEVNQGVEEYNSGKGPEYVISLMNNPAVIERFQAGQESATA